MHVRLYHTVQDVRGARLSWFCDLIICKCRAIQSYTGDGHNHETCFCEYYHQGDVTTKVLSFNYFEPYGIVHACMYV